MRMDIIYSPGAQAGPGPAARILFGHRLSGEGEMCEKCLCCWPHRDLRRERRTAMLDIELGAGVLWRHAASTLKAARPSRLRRMSARKLRRTGPVSIVRPAPQPHGGAIFRAN